jgi:hypothetical protein
MKKVFKIFSSCPFNLCLDMVKTVTLVLAFLVRISGATQVYKQILD